MTSTAEAAAQAAHFTKLGLAQGTVVQELGYDDDVDLDLRSRLMEQVGGIWSTATTVTSSTSRCCGSATATTTSPTQWWTRSPTSTTPASSC